MCPPCPLQPSSHPDRSMDSWIPWIPRAEKSIPPDPSSFFMELVSVSSSSAFHTDFEERVCRYCSFSCHNLVSFSYSSLVLILSRQLVYGHFVYDTSSTDISSMPTDILSTMTVLAEIEAGVMKRIL